MAWKWNLATLTGRPSYHALPTPLLAGEDGEPKDSDSEAPPGTVDATTVVSPFPVRRRGTKLYMIGFWVLLSILLLQLFGVFSFYKLSTWPDLETLCDERARMLKSPIPAVPWTITTFTEDSSMVGLETLGEVEEAWKAFETTGFVRVSEPERYGLSPNRDAIPGTINIYMISAHHQLHCLKKLHVAFTLLLLARNNATNTEADEQAMIGVRHAEHCFNYLRQGIVCAGDATLEGPSADGTLLGYGVRHQCRRWEGEGGLETYRRENAVDHGE